MNRLEVSKELAPGADIFGPWNLECMSLACRVALRAATGEGSPFRAIPEREIYRQIAKAIIAEARIGNLDISHLKAVALHRLAQRHHLGPTPSAH